MSNLVISGLTTITTISLFDGWENISDILDDVRKIACWVRSSLPENKFVRTSIYVFGGVVFLRCIPFILRRTSFFSYYEEQMKYFHRSNSNKEIMAMKQELLKELTDDANDVKLPLIEDDKLVILELNCGTGTNVSYYPEGCVLIGTDFEEENREDFENNFLVSDENHVTFNRFIHTRVEELKGVPDNSVSCVVSFHALCSARKKGRAFDEIRRVLMPGGRLYFIEHTMTNERFSLMWFMQLNFRPTMFLVSCCIDRPEKFIENAGFSEVVIKSCDVDLSTIKGPLRSLTPHVYGYAVK